MLLSDAPAGSRPCAILTASARPSAYPIHKTARSSCPCSKNRSASSVYLVCCAHHAVLYAWLPHTNPPMKQAMRCHHCCSIQFSSRPLRSMLFTACTLPGTNLRIPVGNSIPVRADRIVQQRQSQMLLLHFLPAQKREILRRFILY